MGGASTRSCILMLPLVLLFTAACGEGQQKIDPRFQPLVDSIEAEMISLGASGVAVAIIEGGEVTFTEGFGTKHPDRGEKVGASTLFRIGSVTKMLTAVGLLQQVEAGRVDLEAPITDYLPGFSFSLDASWAPSITVRHLLTHTSAVLDYLELDVDPEYQDDQALGEYFIDEFGEFAYLMAPPARMYNYSNPNFCLAGLITERACGEAYRTYLKDNVLDPLGMERTFLLPADAIADGEYAHGSTVHWETGGPFIAAPDSYDNGWGRPAGYAFSSVLDLARFVLFLRNGNQAVLGEDLRREMQAPQVNTEEALDLAHYGYGLMVTQGAFLGTDYYNTRIISHGGAINGFSADLYFVPDLDFGFITLANTDGAYLLQSLRTAIETLCDLPDPTTPPDLTVDPATYDLYAGEYEDPFAVGHVTVSRQETRLTIQMPDLDAAGITYQPELSPYSPHNFILTVEGTPLLATFILDSQGQVEYLRTRVAVAKRSTTRKHVRSRSDTGPPLDPAELLRRLRQKSITDRPGFRRGLRR